MAMRLILAVAAFFLITCTAIEASESVDFLPQGLQDRIERLRKGDLTIQLVDKEGKPLSGSIRYTLFRHAFQFGCCFDERIFAEDQKKTDVVKYEEIFRRHFNAAVHANSLKWHEMERAKGHVDARTPMRVFDWCEENEITMRGHCIFWGFNGALPAWVRSAPKNELEPLLKERASSVLALFKGRISEFDAINEPLMFAQMAQAMNWQDCAPYFRICREASPDATLYFNEGGLVTPGETQRCLELVKNLLAQEAPLGGIGLKAHCIGRIPDPATLWSALDRFGAFKLPVKIVELSFRNTEDAEQAEGIERLYRAFFAHPAVSGIYLWGFWEGAADLPSCWLWRRDWSPRPSAERLSKLLTEEWTTKGEANVGADGLLRFRGFYGEYRISVGNQEYRAILLPEKLSAKCFPAPPPRKPASADKPPTAPGDF